jgi:hypothetical protein
VHQAIQLNGALFENNLPAQRLLTEYYICHGAQYLPLEQASKNVSANEVQEYLQ